MYIHTTTTIPIITWKLLQTKYCSSYVPPYNQLAPGVMPSHLEWSQTGSSLCLCKADMINWFKLFPSLGEVDARLIFQVAGLHLNEGQVLQVQTTGRWRRENIQNRLWSKWQQEYMHSFLPWETWKKKQIWWHNSYKHECNRCSMTCTIVTGIHYGNEFLLASWRSITNVTMLESIFSSKNKIQTWETKTGDSLEQQSARQWSWGTRGWKPMTSHWWLITINDGIFLYTLQRHTTQVQH